MFDLTIVNFTYPEFEEWGGITHLAFQSINKIDSDLKEDEVGKLVLAKNEN